MSNKDQRKRILHDNRSDIKVATVKPWSGSWIIVIVQCTTHGKVL